MFSSWNTKKLIRETKVLPKEPKKTKQSSMITPKNNSKKPMFCTTIPPQHITFNKIEKVVSMPLQLPVTV